MTELSNGTTGTEQTKAGRGGRTGIRFGRFLVGALAAVSIQAATGALPSIGSSAFAAAGDPGVPAIQLEPVHCDALEINAYSPIITGYNASAGVDSQYIDYELQLEKLVGGAWQPVNGIKPFISGYFVVTDGTGVVIDATVPSLHSFLVPSAGTYRVATIVWWTITGTPINANAYASTSSWFGPVTQFGQHFVPNDVTYRAVDSCQYGNPLWVAQPGGPTIWPGMVLCDGTQFHTYTPTIAANDATEAEDYQEVVYRLQLQQQSPVDNTWQTVTNASLVSSRFVVNDGTGTIKDANLPGYVTFAIPSNSPTATYRVLTSVWWTNASPTSTFNENVWSTLDKAGRHYINTGLLYVFAGPTCTYQAPLTVTITS